MTKYDETRTRGTVTRKPKDSCPLLGGNGNIHKTSRRKKQMNQQSLLFQGCPQIPNSTYLRTLLKTVPGQHAKNNEF